MKRWILAALALALGYGAYVLLTWPSDEEMIRGKLDALAGALRVDVGHADAASRVARIQNAFPRLFTDKVEARIPEAGPPTTDCDDLMALAIAAGEPYPRVNLRLEDVRIAVDPSKKKAEAKTIANLTLFGRSGPPSIERRAVKAVLEKTDGDWKIAAVEVEPKADR